MKKKDILELAGDPRFISGIYNYCDRWCERCAFTSHCMVFAMEEEYPDDPAQHDVDNDAFWRTIQSALEDTKDLIIGLAEEQGIDLASLELGAAAAQNDRLRDEAESHELSKAAGEYAQRVGEWFDAEFKPYERRQRDPEHRAEKSDAWRDDSDVSDAAEVIRWYQHQIGVKIARALMGSAREDPDPDVEWQRDSDGSIKVALIGMDRSLAAWGVFMNRFSDKAGSISPILVHLDVFRRKTEQAFPSARSFIRPGFDEAPTDFVS